MIRNPYKRKVSVVSHQDNGNCSRSQDLHERAKKGRLTTISNDSSNSNNNNNNHDRPPIDVIWLKRDVRLEDHGPFAEVLASPRDYVVLYLYEPDQLQHSSVHGSHICFINEGLQELDAQLASIINYREHGKANHDTVQRNEDTKDNKEEQPLLQSANSNDKTQENKGSLQPPLQAITLCYADCLATLTSLNQHFQIVRLLAHEETGHMDSYIRDRKVRAWCKQQGITCREFPQTGVKRRLQDRDHFSKHFHVFMKQALYDSSIRSNDNHHHKSAAATQLSVSFGKRLLTPEILRQKQCVLPRHCQSLLEPSQIKEIPFEHQQDRPDRQKGGSSEAMRILQSFLQTRAVEYSQGISSPNTSWNSCSRLSPYLSWGHISLRQVIHAIHQRQAQLKADPTRDARWLKSLSAALSRMHWRSHFMQKLEMEPQLEWRDLCPAYQPLRRQPGDWNESYYQAWATGRTGFPFVDACMRCLVRHGWINFRMRAMLVSFATWNLWLDWKRIAPHLARLFLDYEPGIHYPQLQMQAGTTGINAMRVYSVTKQGKDQDPKGVFIRKYVSELEKVPTKYIHEPWTMPVKLQKEIGIMIGASCDAVVYYPSPVVDEKESAKTSKAKFASVRKLESTKQQAQGVYEKHGSRNGSRGISDFRSGKSGAQPAAKKAKTSEAVAAALASSGQRSIKTMFNNMASSSVKAVKKSTRKNEAFDLCSDEGVAGEQTGEVPVRTTEASTTKRLWRCNACTFDNDRPEAPVCAICGTQRTS